MNERYFERLDYDGDLKDEFADVADQFELGEVHGFSLIPVGYEDVNFRLQTDQGPYFVKIFASTRDQGDIDRYAGCIENAIEIGVNHPQLFSSKAGGHVFSPKGTRLQLMVMEWIDGNSFWDLKKAPTPEERSEIVKFAAKLNSSQYKPSFTYDSWAVTSFKKEFEEHSGVLEEGDRTRIQEVLNAFNSLDIEALPHSFVHGDLIAPNVLRSDKDLYFVDFSVSNYYPRIQELAVLFSNLLFVESSEETSKEIYRSTIEEYSKIHRLSDKELAALGIYTLAAHSMHVIGASKAIERGEDAEQSKYWLNLGRTGLSFDFYN